MPHIQERPLASYHRTAGPVAMMAAVNFGPNVCIKNRKEATRMSGTATLPNPNTSFRAPSSSDDEECPAFTRSYDKNKRSLKRRKGHNMSRWVSTPNLCQTTSPSDLSDIYSSLMRGLGEDFMDELASKASTSNERTSWSPWLNIQRNIPSVRRSFARVKTLPASRKSSSRINSDTDGNCDTKDDSTVLNDVELSGSQNRIDTIDEDDADADEMVSKTKLLAAACAFSSPELILGRTYVACCGLGYINLRTISKCDTNCSLLLWQCPS